MLQALTLLFVVIIYGVAAQATGNSTRYQIPNEHQDTITGKNQLLLFRSENIYTDLYDRTSQDVPGSTALYGIGGNYEGKNKLFSWRLSGNGIWSTASSYMYTDIPNMYVEVGASSNHSLSFGRKFTSWSSDDDIWKRGLWAPRSIFKATEPMLQSLTGFLYEGFKKSPIKLKLFTSFISIPDLAIPFEEIDGSFVSRNPNFKKPSSEIVLGESTIDIKYKKNVDDINEILFNPSIAGEISGEINNINLSLGLAYKPLNQIALKAPLQITTGAEEGAYIKADVTPTVTYHSLATAQVSGSLQENLFWGGSLTYDRPEIEKQPDNILQKNLDETYIYSVFLKSKFPALNAEGLISYSSLTGGDLEDTGEFSSRTDTRFPIHYQYTRAVKLKWKQKFDKLSNLIVLGELNYDFVQKVTVSSLKADLLLYKKFILHLDYTNVSLHSNNFDKPREMYWHGLLDTDSVNLGVKYVF